MPVRHASLTSIGEASSFSRFFLLMAIALSTIMVAGFWETYYLRASNDLPALPPHLHIHGAFQTSWFALFLVQASLIQRGGVSLHKKLGILGFVVGFIAAISGLIATIGAPARVAESFNQPSLDVGDISAQFWLNTTVFLSVLLFLSAAFLLRRKPHLHKRLILATSIAMMPPPIRHMFAAPPAVPIGLLALFSLLFAYDYLTHKRINVASWLPCAFMFVLVGVCIGLVAPSEVGQQVVRWLMQK